MKISYHLVVGVFWVVIGGFEWLWVVVGGFDWLWVVLDGFGWFCLVPCFTSNILIFVLQKPRLTSIQTGKQLIAIHVLPKISRSKGNQAMKFGQLIEYNVKM